MFYQAELPAVELTDALHEYFRNTRFVGETLLLDTPPASSIKINERVVIIKQESEPTGVSYPNQPVTVHPIQSSDVIFQTNGPPIPIPAESFLRVHLLADPAKQFIVPGAMLKRDRVILSKIFLKKYIKDVATRIRGPPTYWHVRVCFLIAL